MKLIKSLFPILAPVFALLATGTVPALAQTNIYSPSSGQTVGTTFTLNMSADSCSGLPVAAVGYSLDDSSATSAWQANSINGPVGSGTGWHTLHVKVWNNQGGICVTDVSINVVDGGGSGGSGNSISPASGSNVSSPFTLSANIGSCSGQGVSTIGYSIDDSGYTATFPGQNLNASVSAGSGWHTVHVKSWDNNGDVCVSDVSVNVTGGGAAPASAAAVPSGGGSNAMSVVPSYATEVSSIQTLPDWTAIHDDGTPGWSSGSLSLTGSPSLSGSALLFANEFGGYGGERYAAQFSDDVNAQNFFYDTWVYIAGDASGFMNLEFDLNQTMANGETALMGFQCDGWNNSWDYTVNGASPDNPWDTWQHSGAYCNPQSWGANQWHHVQIFISHDQNGWVTYHSVWLDGNEQDLNANVFSGFNLGWGPAIVTNFQVDGSSNGTTWANIYMDNMTVYRW